MNAKSLISKIRSWVLGPPVRNPEKTSARSSTQPVGPRPMVAPSTGGCALCSPVAQELPLDAELDVGFGSTALLVDRSVTELHALTQPCRTLADVERIAARQPQRNWRLRFITPLRASVFQRQGPGRWVLVESGPGFA